MKKSKRKSSAAPRGAVPAAREVFYTSQARDDLSWWRRQDPRTLARIEALIAAIARDPFSGTGKPEPLRFEWQGYWSRRITREHRLVYRVESGVLYAAQARYHY